MLTSPFSAGHSTAGRVPLINATAMVSSLRGTNVVLVPGTEVHTSGSSVVSMVPCPTPTGTTVSSYGAAGQSGGGSVVVVCPMVDDVTDGGTDVVVGEGPPLPEQAAINTTATSSRVI